MGKDTLSTLAKVIRSKNAGPFELTFDIMCDDVAKYEHVKRSGLISAARIASYSDSLGNDATIRSIQSSTIDSAR